MLLAPGFGMLKFLGMLWNDGLRSKNTPDLTGTRDSLGWCNVRLDEEVKTLRMLPVARVSCDASEKE